LGIWNDKQTLNHHCREQHGRAATFAAKLIMENLLIHNDVDYIPSQVP
jgi:hypothetical protein